VSGIASGEFDLAQRLWVIPKERAKNNREHEVSLSDAAIDELKRAIEQKHKIDDLMASPLVFTTNGKSQVSGFSRAKGNLDIEIERLSRKARGLPEDDTELRKALKLKAGAELPRYVAAWTLHDLRRTAASGMARLGIAPHVVDKILNHVAGTIKGVAAIYNRYQYSDERRAALEAWSRYLESLVRPAAPSNVTDFVAARAAR
jgi:integrase